MNKTSPIFCDKVNAEQAGKRLDAFLTQAIDNHSRSQIQHLITNGFLSKDGSVFTDNSYKIKEGECYELLAAPVRDISLTPDQSDLHIFHQDDDIIVFYKPAGLTVHIGAGHHDHTLVNILLHHTGGKLSILGGDTRPGIVHRLDKDTSGIMVAAKTDVAYVGLAEQFSTHTIKREYDAFCWGVPSPIQGQIDTPIGRHPHQRKKMTVLQSGGKHAITNYRTVDTYHHGKISHIRCRLETGRTHQIRVHMAFLGHPLIGDQTYGKDKRFLQTISDDQVKEAVRGIGRQMLHARLLEFIHPVTGKKMSFSMNLPDDMKHLKSVLEA